MIYGEVVQRWRVASGAKLMKWPKEQSKSPVEGGGMEWQRCFSVGAAWEEGGGGAAKMGKEGNA